MKEKIYICSNLNETELLRTLSRLGKDTIGVHIMNVTKLSDYLLKKNGIFYSEKFVNRKEEPFFIFPYLKDIPYFKNASYKDAENIANTLFDARMLIESNEHQTFIDIVNKGIFKNKNEGIVSIFEKYEDVKGKNGYIDSIDLVRRFLNEEIKSDVSFSYFKEYPLTPLENAVATKLGAVEESILDLFGVKEPNYPSFDIYDSYGVSNEVEKILSDIIISKTNYDDTLIAVANPNSYVGYLLEYSTRFDIPMTFGTGVNIMQSNPGKLLKQMCEAKSKYFGKDALSDLLTSSELDRKKLKEDVFSGDNTFHLTDLAELVGNIKIGFYENINDQKLKDLEDVLVKKAQNASSKDKEKFDKNVNLIPYAKKLVEILEQGYSYFISNYSYKRLEKPFRNIDSEGLSVIENFFTSMDSYLDDSDKEKAMQNLFQKNIMHEASNDSSIHIVSIDDAINTVRKEVYIMGMTSSNFPGTPKENYLLLDSDYINFNGDNAPTVKNRMKNRIDNLDTLLYILNGANSKVTMSFPSYSLTELKDDNPSSYLFNVYSKNYPNKTMDDFKKELKHIESFSGSLSSMRNIGKSYAEGKNITFSSPNLDIPKFDYTTVTFSPSAISKYLECPREFFYKYVLKLEDKSIDDPFEILPAYEKGNLAHYLMDYLDKNKGISKDDFLTEAKNALNDFFKIRCPITNTAKEEDDFIHMMDNAYDMNNGKEVIETEYYLEGVNKETSLKLGGYCDRIEKDSDGTYVIVDFKSGHKIEAIKDDIKSCIQVAIYAYLYKEMNPEIKIRCEYRYLSQNTIVTFDCENLDDDLTTVLGKFKNDLDNMSFNSILNCKNKDECKYCSYKSLCSKTNEDLNNIIG